MANYNADIQIAVKGKAQLNQLETQLKRITKLQTQIRGVTQLRVNEKPALKSISRVEARIKSSIRPSLSERERSDQAAVLAVDLMVQDWQRPGSRAEVQ